MVVFNYNVTVVQFRYNVSDGIGVHNTTNTPTIDSNTFSLMISHSPTTRSFFSFAISFHCNTYSLKSPTENLKNRGASMFPDWKWRPMFAAVFMLQFITSFDVLYTVCLCSMILNPLASLRSCLYHACD